jgi:formate dehydrogenase iron-sulfur subunit
MVAEAQMRMAKRPGAYFNKIYGLDEAGGTSVLYLSAAPFEELGFRKVTYRPIPELTWQALRVVPGMFLTVAGSLSLISWLTHRKEQIAREEEERKELDEGSAGGEK